MSKPESNRVQLTTFSIKMVAIVSMLLDHIGAVFYTNVGSTEFLWLRYVGRIAFPIFCFLLVEGFVHTSNRAKYGVRLLVFAILSEIPYDLAFHDQIFEIGGQNVFWTLLIGYLMLCLMEKCKNPVLSFFLFILAAVSANYFSTDYSYAGIMFILCFYLFRCNTMPQFLSFALINYLFLGRIDEILYTKDTSYLFMPMIQDFAIVSLGFLWFYNYLPGRKMKWFFYFFYPVHLLVLFFINRFIL